MAAVKLGTDVKVTGTFENLVGAVFDPATVTCIVQKPDGTETSYVYGTDAALVKDSTGVYHIWVPTAQFGVYFIRFKGGGTVKVANETSFTVTRSAFVTP